MAGFNLPPGCSVRDIPGNGPDQPCDVCGKFPESASDPCICPECPECGSIGDPRCYALGQLTRTQAQIDSFEAAKKEWEAEAAREAAMEKQWEADRERAMLEGPFFW